MELKAPWLKFYDGIRHSLSYPDATISKTVWDIAEKYPNTTALVYMGRKISYCELIEAVQKVQQFLEKLGIKEGDRIMVCLPNIPQAVYLLYAADGLGAVCSFVHPLSAEDEIVRYVSQLDAVCIVALDSMQKTFCEVFLKTGEKKLILTSVEDEMGFVKKNICKISRSKSGVKNLALAEKSLCFSAYSRVTVDSKTDINNRNIDDTAVILFSGGTSGKPKGVMLSGKSINAMAMQIAHMSCLEVKGKSMLAAMPIFHGFGLCVCVHAVLMHGGTCVLVPKFSAGEYARLIRRHRPDFIVGVPTLFEALIKEPLMKKLDLSCLSGVFCGGDALPMQLKADFDRFLSEHNSKAKIREGYGATECVTASCLTPQGIERQGSVGIPLPDTYYKICSVGTTREAPYGTEGEICIHGPTLMKGYLNSPQETENALKMHDDGYIWLHTGDAGVMDKDGFVYFKRRLRRMIITSGYNVYPDIIEGFLDEHPKVSRSCVVGISDPYKMQKVKAYIIPAKGVVPDRKLINELALYCSQRVAKYSLPAEYEFMSEFPLTKLGKIDYCRLEK